MTINIRDRLTRARALGRTEHAEAEVLKLGTLRVGSGGMMADTGDIAGQCHRKAHVRSLGLEVDPPDESKLMMFELGYASEDVTVDLLSKSLEPGEVILREEEIPISWTTQNGTKVSGRPDIVLCQGDAPKPLLGLELKSVHSMWTARDVLFGARDLKTGQNYPAYPKLDNMIQAGHYMWRLGIPYKLIYKAYSTLGQSADQWASKVINLPAPGEPNSQYIDYDRYGKYKSMRQFEIVYDLMIDGQGRVSFKREEEPESKWQRTLISTQDIERYYNHVAEMGSKKDLGARPLTIDAFGEKLGYKQCGFCPLQSTCDQYEESGYDTWLAAVKEKLNETK